MNAVGAKTCVLFVLWTYEALHHQQSITGVAHAENGGSGCVQSGADFLLCRRESVSGFPDFREEPPGKFVDALLLLAF